jgi:hypothetical protein
MIKRFPVAAVKQEMFDEVFEGKNQVVDAKCSFALLGHSQEGLSSLFTRRERSAFNQQ